MPGDRGAENSAIRRTGHFAYFCGQKQRSLAEDKSSKMLATAREMAFRRAQCRYQAQSRTRVRNAAPHRSPQLLQLLELGQMCPAEHQPGSLQTVQSGWGAERVATLHHYACLLTPITTRFILLSTKGAIDAPRVGQRCRLPASRSEACCSIV
eukprot:6196020-Prymnesium_polylepis.1